MDFRKIYNLFFSTVVSDSINPIFDSDSSSIISRKGLSIVSTEEGLIDLYAKIEEAKNNKVGEIII